MLWNDELIAVDIFMTFKMLLKWCGIVSEHLVAEDVANSVYEGAKSDALHCTKKLASR